MKQLYLIGVFLLIAVAGSAQSEDTLNNKSLKDTLEFSIRWDFIGDCGKDCYKFLGTGDIVKINGRSIGESCNHIFIKCPSDVKLQKDKIYKFIATPFIPNQCSTIIDTCLKNKTYLILNEVK